MVRIPNSPIRIKLDNSDKMSVPKEFATCGPPITFEGYLSLMNKVDPSAKMLNQHAGSEAWMADYSAACIRAELHRPHQQPRDAGPSACNTCYWRHRGMEPPQESFINPQ